MSRVLLEKLTFTLTVKKFPALYGNRGFITCSQVPTTGPYPEPDASNPQLLNLFPQDPF